MNPQQAAAVVGAAVTSFLLVGAATIEAVTAAVGGDVGPGVVGVFVGAVAGLGAATAVRLRWATVRPFGRALLIGYGAFGLAILFLALLSYVDVPGADEYLGLRPNLAVAAVVAVVAAAAAWRRGHPASLSAGD